MNPVEWFPFCLYDPGIQPMVNEIGSWICPPPHHHHHHHHHHPHHAAFNAVQAFSQCPAAVGPGPDWLCPTGVHPRSDWVCPPFLNPGLDWVCPPGLDPGLSCVCPPGVPLDPRPLPISAVRETVVRP
uniref:Uncharacterized protein n=1 Tax=Knipowitschia caucasica TaxID=637954 RepID=A0AAV2KQV9_KNICA